MICVTFEVSTGGSLTNLEKTWNPGAQTLMNFDSKPPLVSNSCNAFCSAASRVLSCNPSWPRARKPYCLSRNPPASFGSNSATFKVAAPKSAARNDFTFSIARLRYKTVHAQRAIVHAESGCVLEITHEGQTRKSFLATLERVRIERRFAFSAVMPQA